MISDYGRTAWPGVEGIPQPFIWNPLSQEEINRVRELLQNMPSKEEIDEFKRLLDKAREFDKVAKQPDCPDPEKVKWLEKLETLRKLIDDLNKELNKNV